MKGSIEVIPKPEGDVVLQAAEEIKLLINWPPVLTDIYSAGQDQAAAERTRQRQSLLRYLRARMSRA